MCCNGTQQFEGNNCIHAISTELNGIAPPCINNHVSRLSLAYRFELTVCQKKMGSIIHVAVKAHHIPIFYS
jgi:hypothetical protein